MCVCVLVCVLGNWMWTPALAPFNLFAFKVQVYETHLFWRELLKAIFQFDVCISHHLDYNPEKEDYFVYSLTGTSFGCNQG